jgi:hypothetical protein
MSTAWAWWPIIPETKSTSALVNGGRPLSAAAMAAGDFPVGEMMVAPDAELARVVDAHEAAPRVAATRTHAATTRGSGLFIPTPSVGITILANTPDPQNLLALLAERTTTRQTLP